MSKKKRMAKASLVLSIISLIPLIINLNNLIAAEVLIIVGIIIAIVSVILGFTAKSEAKGLSIAGIIVGIFSLIVLCITLMGFLAIKNVKDCVDKGNNTATCSYMGQEIEVPIPYLTEEQMKKGE